MSDDRWKKLKAGLYDAIYGKGLAKPYLDATARLLDELHSDYETLRTKLADTEAKLAALIEACKAPIQPEDGSILGVTHGVTETLRAIAKKEKP